MILSDLLGSLSIGCWLCAQAPQVYLNYQNQSVEGLALTFLAVWLVGDLTNFIGCIFTDQLPFQIYLAIYFLFIDVFLVYQYTTYSKDRPHRHRHGRYRDASVHSPVLDGATTASWRSQLLPASAGRTPSIANQADPMVASFYSEITSTRRRDDSVPSHRVTSSLDRGRAMEADAAVRAARAPSATRRSTSVLFLGVVSFVGLSALAPRQLVTPLNDLNATAWPLEGAPTVLPVEVVFDWRSLIGRTAAWTCAVCYLCSRMPQLWHNFRRKSVEGLSPLLFLAAFSGNLLYTGSIMLSPYVKTDPTFLSDAVPYLIGSGGTLCFDLTILSQIVIYRRRKARRRKERRRRLTEEAAIAADETALLGASASEDETDPPSILHRSRSIPRLPATIAEETASLVDTPAL